MNLRPVYKALGVALAVRAVTRGPGAVARFMVRRHAHRALARVMRRWGA